MDKEKAEELAERARKLGLAEIAEIWDEEAKKASEIVDELLDA